MKKIALLILSIVVLACSTKSNDLVVKTHISGLKKGTVYLKRLSDSTIITVDSVNISGDSEIVLRSDLDQPEVFYLFLDKNSKEDEGLAFFASKGTTEIKASLKYFPNDAKIIGSEEQKLLEAYQKLKSRLNNRNLELIKEAFDAQKSGDTAAIKEVTKKQDNLIKARYLQTVNFAINNKNSAVAPYVVLAEIYDVNTKYLDTIFATLTPEIKSSRYGLHLRELIDKRKKPVSR